MASFQVWMRLCDGDMLAAQVTARVAWRRVAGDAREAVLRRGV
jgi:hypothetical protein